MKPFTQFTRLLADLRRGFSLVRAAAPRQTAVWGALLILQGLLPAATVALTRLLVDHLVALAGRGASADAVRDVATAAGALALLLLVNEVLQGLADQVRTIQAELVQDHVAHLIQKKSASVDLAFYESPDYHDRLSRARSDSASRPVALLENVGSMAQSAITLVAMAGILLPYGAWLPLLLLVSTAPAFYALLRSQRANHRWWERTTTDRRWTQYHEQVLTGSWTAAELRLFGLAEYFQNVYQALRSRLRGEKLSLVRQQARARVFAGLVALAVSGAAMIWMLVRVFHGQGTLGDLALFYQAFQRGQTLMRTLLSNLGQLYSHTLFLANLFEFLALQPRVVSPARPVAAPLTLRSEIRFRDVTFRYPGSTRPALEHFDLVVPAGLMVAVIGSNGAGKSTLIKLLCRLYDPDQGCIEWDGTDIRRFALEEYRRLLTVQFQIPVAYQATMAQNIVFSDLKRADDRSGLEEAARWAGADSIADRMPNGYQALLGRWFVAGTELSAGQWQRIALARAFFRRSPVMVLDEPTSFIDSWAEAEWVARFRLAAAGRTALIVTHRLPIAMRCDLICVMEAGKIVECGTHTELLAHGGRYAQCWSTNTRPDWAGGDAGEVQDLYADPGRLCRNVVGRVTAPEARLADAEPRWNP